MACPGCSKRSTFILLAIMIFMGLAILGETCGDGACGGFNSNSWRIIGYVCFGLSLVAVCVGIGTSQKGQSIDTNSDANPEDPTAKLV